MTEEQLPPEDAAGETGPDSVEPTGHPVVDDVVASLAGLEDRPVSEHVEVFESAHDRLRGALADAGDDSPA